MFLDSPCLQLCGQTDHFSTIIQLASPSLGSADTNSHCVWMDQQRGYQWTSVVFILTDVFVNEEQTLPVFEK